MSVLISGSIAYDNILSYGGRFGEHLISGSLDHINLSFVTDTMVKNYGGCAANIAYALKLLGGDPLVVGAVGTDGTEYLYRFDELGIDHAVIKLNDTYTAQGFVTTDTTGSQITAFNPGAMLHSQEAKTPEGKNITLALIGPDGKEGMLTRAKELTERKIPYIFDLGQAAPLFNGEEIKHFIEGASYVFTSLYEMELITRATGLTAKDIAATGKPVLVTDGENGSTVYTKEKEFHVGASRTNAIDPVGAGDAYRGGMLYGMVKGYDWEKTMQIASVMGSFKVEKRGAQTYAPTKEEIAERIKKTYGSQITL